MVAVDGQDNVVASGFIQNAGTGRDFTVAKFNSDGALLWKHTLNATADVDDEAFSVTVDMQGNIVAAGTILDPEAGNTFTVAKYNPDGGLLWKSATIRGGDAISVAVDGRGNVVAAGNGDGKDITDAFLVVKFSPDGAPLWQGALNHTGRSSGNTNLAESVTIDAQGNVVAAGRSVSTDGAYSFTVTRFDLDGHPLWQRVLDDTVNPGGEAISVAVDSQRNVVASGYAGNGLFTAVKLNADGALLWRRTLPDTGDRSGFALSVAVDGQGDVVAAGVTSNRFTVAKFRR
jgi:uncharacterized delta-60 repeat protein